MVVNSHDIDGIRFYNISGLINIVAHNEKEIKIECDKESELGIKETEGFLDIFIKKEDEHIVSKSFFHRVFKSSFKTNIHHNSSYIEEKNTINIYQPLITDMTIYVPQSLIEKIYIDGNLKLYGDGFTSFLKIYANGNNTIDIKNIRNSYLDTTGRVECFFKNCTNSSIYSIGNSFIKINSKSINNLQIKNKGELEIDVIGNIDELSVDGNGITKLDVVGKVKNKKIKRKGFFRLSINN